MIIKTQTIEEKNVCENCGHSWIQRGRFPPKVCSRCKNVDWNLSGTVQDLTRPIEEIPLNIMDVEQINRFEYEYGINLEQYIRMNK